jgi:carboxyl-terminal processing protease
MRARRLLAIVAGVLVLLVAFVGGVVVGGHADATGLTQLRDPLRGFLLGESGESLPDQVLEVLRDDYYKPIDEKKLESLSVDRMIEALDDPYTDYLSADELAALRQSYDGTYSGVGLVLAARGDSLVVRSVVPDGPADQAGITSGDRLVSIDGKRLTGPDLAGAAARVRGPEGTQVRLGVVTGDGPVRQLTLTRRELTAPPVLSRMETVGGRKVGYLRLPRFVRGSATALSDAVKRLRAKGAEALVLDLRQDPGGLVTEAVGVAGVFLPSGTPVAVTQGLHSGRETLTTSGDPAAGDLPLAVLVDQNSASASEIVAGALRDADRAVLVGDRTFGKALVQTSRPLRDGGALKLTIARYLTPDGYDLAKRGLPPGVKVTDDPDTPADEVLQRGLRQALVDVP